jgi:hypothetical protein
MKFFNFLFYKSYKLAIQLGNEGFFPEVKAWFIAMLLPWLNLLSILIILKNNLLLSMYVFRIILIGSSLFWIFSFVFCIIKDNYIKILSSQENSSLNNSFSNIIYYSYLLVTCVIYFVFLAD